MVIWLCQDSQPGSNRYGANPVQQKVCDVQSVISERGMLAVKCLSGTLRGQIYRIGSKGIVMGRAADCAIRFGDGVPGISSQHCCIRMEGGVPFLIDLNSQDMGRGWKMANAWPPDYPERINVGSKFYLGSPGKYVSDCLYVVQQNIKEETIYGGNTKENQNLSERTSI